MRHQIIQFLLIILIPVSLHADPRQDADRQLDLAYREFQEVIKAPQAHISASHADLGVMLARVRCNDRDRAILRGMLAEPEKYFPPNLPEAQKPLAVQWHLALIHAATGDRAQAMKHWTTAKEIFPRLEYPMPIAKAIHAHGLAWYAAEWGEYDKALALAQAYPMLEAQPGEGPLTLLRGIRTRNDRAMYDRAITEASAAPVKPDQKDDLIGRIAQARANVGDFTGALETARPIPAGYRRHATFMQIAREADEGEDLPAVKQALTAAMDATDEAYRFNEILSFAVELRDKDLFSPATKDAQSRFGINSGDFLSTAPRLAQGYVLFNQDEAAARRIMKQLEDFTKNRPDAERETYEALLARAACHAILGEHQQANDLLSRVPAKHMEFAENLDDVQLSYLALDDFKRAADVIDKHLKPEERRFYQKAYITHALRKGRIDLALEQAAKVTDPLEKERQWRRIARAQARAGQHAQAIEWIDKLPSPRARVLARLAVAEELLKVAPNRYMTLYPD